MPTAPAPALRKRLRRRRKELRGAAARAAKHSLTVVGARLPDPALYAIAMTVNYLRLGRWMRVRGYSFPARLPHRTDVWDAVLERIADRKVLYLEFGVHRGRSMRYWSERLRHPDARLEGFDSFEGLPEDFDERRYPKGRFSTGGVPPALDDPRVRFHQGWFEDTLPAYELPEHDVLFVNLDADLYSSTIYVLRQLRGAIGPGVYLYFDDLSRPEHEPKAFDEFTAETGLAFRAVAADRTLNHAVFECIGRGGADG
ncbi:MAG: TylF/MycF family methyltransferase [Actinomycetota bacterium]|nr:TylF/MycF family methyltransferase [Actinomycetota bacterium]